MSLWEPVIITRESAGESRLSKARQSLSSGSECIATGMYLVLSGSGNALELSQTQCAVLLVGLRLTFFTLMCKQRSCELHCESRKYRNIKMPFTDPVSTLKKAQLSICHIACDAESQHA